MGVVIPAIIVAVIAAVSIGLYFAFNVDNDDTY